MRDGEDEPAREEKMEGLNAVMGGVGAWAKADSLPHPRP